MRIDSLLSSVNVVLVMAFGSLVFVLLFIFVKRQIMRFAMKSRRGPHVPLGHNAPKELRQEIEAKLGHVQKVHFEPRLLWPEDDWLKQSVLCGTQDCVYRVRALDAIRDTDLPFRELGGTPAAVTGKRLRTWLLQLRNSHCMFQDSLRSLVDTVLDGYSKARHGAEGQVSERRQHSDPAAPVRSQRPNQPHRARQPLILPDPDHLPHIVNAAAQQAAQELPGAEELQRQLQHSGQFVLRRRPNRKVKDEGKLSVIKVPAEGDRGPDSLE
uniref:Uncharacterized protein n=1 Tax=Gasterosteus aculeatus aculeatus TaxID=481459 RepID=A0AAQ4R8E4_GASAC